jgi:hypothetical protein
MNISAYITSVMTGWYLLSTNQLRDAPAAATALRGLRGAGLFSTRRIDNCDKLRLCHIWNWAIRHPYSAKISRNVCRGV